MLYHHAQPRQSSARSSCRIHIASFMEQMGMFRAFVRCKRRIMAYALFTAGKEMEGGSGVALRIVIEVC